VAIHGQNSETVAWFDAEHNSHGMRQSQQSIEMTSKRALIADAAGAHVDERHLVG
jgi:hypothetical protein